MSVLRKDVSDEEWIKKREKAAVKKAKKLARKENVEVVMNEVESVVGGAFQCSHCKLAFASKNKLFAHLRSTPCGEAVGLKKEPVMKKYALYFGYDGQAVEKAGGYETVARDMIVALSKMDIRLNAEGKLEGMSVSSSHEGRTSPFYRQDEGASASMDVFCFTCLERKENESALVESMNAALPAWIRVFTWTTHSTFQHFHGETSCIRRTYEFLIPLNTVFDASIRYQKIREKTRTWEEKAKNSTSQQAFTALSSGGHVVDEDARLAFFQKLKRVLHSFHGERAFHNFTKGAVAPKTPNLILLTLILTLRTLFSRKERLSLRPQCGGK